MSATANASDVQQVVIASRLGDGLVVFLAEPPADGPPDWVERLESAALAPDDTRANELLELAERDAGERHLVVDPYLIDVAEQDGALRPTKYREAIRVLGPTIRPDLGRQAESSQS